MKKLLFIFFILISSISLNATHIIGGELYYDCLGGNTYRITVKVYRDCFLGEAPFDNPAKISVWSGTGTLIQVVNINFPGSSFVPFITSNPCFQAPPNVCVEEAIYTTVVTLPASVSGYIFAYQRCCRNNSILNLVGPGDTGATYTEQVPTADLCNNSPRYNNFPPIALCINEPLVFDHSATDPDGDSLVYYLCNTFDGASPLDPAPDVTSPPPFSPITFLPPYTSLSPMSSIPPIAIDPVTGILTVTPNVLGQYVVGVCVDEYRDGVKIGTHSRDFQFNVTNCLSNVQSNVELPNNFIPEGGVFKSCEGLTVPFQNLSINGTYYHWDFGVPATSADTSNLVTPTYTFPNSGTYTVTLITNPGYFCADTDRVTIIVAPFLDIDFTPPPGQCITGNNFNFAVTGSYDPLTSFNWDFGPNAIPASSNSTTPTNIVFDQTGFQTITLTAGYLACQDTAIHDVLVYGRPFLANIDVDTIGCVIYDAHFDAVFDTAYNNIEYLWTFGDGGTSTIQDPIHNYVNPGVYSVTFLAISTTGCKDTIFISKPNWITVNPSPIAGFTAQPLSQSIFSPNFYFIEDYSPDVVDCWIYYDNGDSSQNCTGPYTYQDTGHYNVTQIVYNSFGCPDTMIIPIVVTPEFVFNVPNTFTINGDGINEGFRGYGIGIKEYEFSIYDRWGRYIFRSNDLYEEWNGLFFNTGAEVPEGIYAYGAHIKDVFGVKHFFAGKVFLSRSDFSK